MSGLLADDLSGFNVTLEVAHEADRVTTGDSEDVPFFS